MPFASEKVAQPYSRNPGNCGEYSKRLRHQAYRSSSMSPEIVNTTSRPMRYGAKRGRIAGIPCSPPSAREATCREDRQNYLSL